jgi:hypothetical protein
MKLMLEAEVAAVLRCDRQKVKRLRLSGKLPYLPGRPVLIDEADLAAFISGCKRRGVVDDRPDTEVPVRGPSSEADDARDWAVKALLKQQRRKPRVKP